MQLVEQIDRRLANLKPNIPHCNKTGGPPQYPTFCHFYCFIQMRSILHLPGRLRHTSFPAKVTIFFRRVFGCCFLPGCVGEELGGTWSCLKQNNHGQNSVHYRHSNMGLAADNLDQCARWNSGRMAFSMHTSAHAIWYTCMPSSFFCILPSIILN